VNSSPIRALLLAGHSNSGKSPVGSALAEALCSSSRTTHHLDFGDLLRRTCSADINPGFSEEHLRLIGTFMHGRLLDDGSFFVAQRLIEWFLDDRAFVPGRDVLILNGMPRDAAQAIRVRAMGIVVDQVVHLDCSAETAWRRKQRSEDGTGFEDRSDRGDAAHQVFERKVRSFLRDTLPLLDYYRSAGAIIHRVPVQIDTGPDDVVRLTADALRRNLIP
jgi:adenylate kinase family enzyme